MKHLKILFIFSLLTLSSESFSQMGITSYSIYAIGINTSQNNRISGELKTFANRLVDEINLEADVFYNFKAGSYHRFSAGLGALRLLTTWTEYMPLLFQLPLKYFPFMSSRRYPYYLN